MTDAFSGAIARLQDSGAEPQDFSAPFLDVFPITGAAVSTIGDFLGSETLSATDDRAVRRDELQFDLGEGPCWDTLRLFPPILEPDVTNHPRTVWRAYSPAMREQDVGSIFAFRLRAGVTIDESFEIIRSYARSHRLGIGDVAARLVARTLILNADGPAVEPHDEGGSDG